MKKEKLRVFCKLFYVLLVSTVTTQTFSQEKEIITISSNEVDCLKKKFEDDVIVYQVQQQEVNEYIHKKELNRLSTIFSKNSMTDKLESISQKYENNLKYVAFRRLAITSIKTNIESYFASSEKPKNKQQYLIDAQKVADENNIEVTISMLEVIPNNVNNHYRREIKVKARLVVENQRKPVSDDVIKKYYDELNKIVVKNASKPYEMRLKEQIDSLSTISTKRSAYVALGHNAIKLDDVIGNFTLETEKYITCSDSNYEYQQYELIDNKDAARCGIFSNKKYPILKNVDTNILYVILADRCLLMIQDLNNSKDLAKTVNSMGYKENYTKEGHAYINTKTAKIPLGYWLETELKNDKNFITNFDNEQLKIASLKNQTPQHSKTLDKFLGQYRIQKNKMSTADINAWRNATTSAKKLFDQIYKLNEKYIGNYNFTLLKEPITYEDFLDNLNASRGILGI